MNDDALIELLHERFIAHGWHDASAWEGAKGQLSSELLASIRWMEETGGEPAVAPWWQPGDALKVCDCSTESPAARRSLCYDRAAWEKRKKARPEGDAVSMAAEHDARLMAEEEYLELQERGDFDLKSSSWLLTADAVRSKGGAIFGDRRFGRAFIYCNGAESYYGVRGFRAVAEKSSCSRTL